MSNMFKVAKLVALLVTIGALSVGCDSKDSNRAPATTIKVEPISSFEQTPKEMSACIITLTKSKRELSKKERITKCRSNPVVRFYNPLEKDMGKYAKTLCPDAIRVFADPSSFVLACEFPSK